MSVAEDVWDKRRSESAKAFAAFAIYRDQLAGRSLSKVAAVVGKDLRWMKSWSALHDWVARAHAYDAHLDRSHQEQQERDRADMLVRHAKAAIAVQTTVLKALAQVAPDDLTTSDIPRWLDVAVRIERMARGAGEPDSEKVKAPYIALWERLGGLPTGTDG